MKNKIFAGFFIIILVLSSCSHQLSKTCNQQKDYKNNEYLLQSVMWFQHSGEMRALYYQAYNIAKYSLNNYLEQSKSLTKKAVIVDIDETILDNSPFEAQMLLTDSIYSDGNWKHWVDKSIADTLPGALNFLNYAKSKGVEVFYISNRAVLEVEPTLKNLKKFDFPFADEDHLLFKSDKSSSKEIRRKKIAQDYDIALLCGDNLGDFSAVFDNRIENQLNDSVDVHWADFGKRFIVLPNPMYGSWENQIYPNKKLNTFQRDSISRASLISY